MTRPFAVLSLLVLAAAALAASALAAKPIRGPAASPGELDFPAGMVCSFPVHATPLENRQTETIFSSGKVQVTGFFASGVVNAANGKELSLVTPGPVRLTQEGDLLAVNASGPLLVFFFPGDAGPGDVTMGRLYLVRGHTQILVDPSTFTFLSFSSSGSATDICAALA
jgi:hypothetical protein